MLNALFAKIEAPGTPEKISENDYLIKGRHCNRFELVETILNYFTSKAVMRIIMTARRSLLPIYEQILNHLVQILSVISKNPSNPNFDQYLFESISALIKYVLGYSKELPIVAYPSPFL